MSRTAGGPQEQHRAIAHGADQAGTATNTRARQALP